MKKAVAAILLLWLCMVAIPIAAVRDIGSPPTDFDTSPSVRPTPSPAAGSSPHDASVAVRVLMHQSGNIEEMSMSDYLFGVVAAEMPASFNEEALKAQAVAARSYTLYKMQRRRENPDVYPQHNGADVCTDINHCKAYTAEAEARESWGADYELCAAKIRACIAATDGQAALFDGEPISAVFHAISSGRTERAVDVWGSDVPYLQSVDSPGDTLTARYASEAEYTAQEFFDILENTLGVEIDGFSPQECIGPVTRSAAGGVTDIVLCGREVGGRQVRSAFGLRSTCFELTYDETGGKFVFSVHGYGHGVGMSQYGAQYMALNGSSYEDIIKWYYSGVTVGVYDFKDDKPD